MRDEHEMRYGGWYESEGWVDDAHGQSHDEQT